MKKKPFIEQSMLLYIRLNESLIASPMAIGNQNIAGVFA